MRPEMHPFGMVLDNVASMIWGAVPIVLIAAALLVALRLIVGMIIGAIVGAPDDKARRLGDIGEQLTRKALKRLDPNVYAVLPDPAVSRRLILPDGRGGTAELDLVVFSRFGIFALEVKHWRGFVFGRKNDRVWTVTYLGRKKFKDSNPLRQNSGKLKALQKITRLPSRAFYSVAVLSSDECEFKSPDRPENVVYLNELADYILAKREAIMSDGEVSDAIVKVINAADKSPDAMERHVESLRTRPENKRVPKGI